MAVDILKALTVSVVIAVFCISSANVVNGLPAGLTPEEIVRLTNNTLLGDIFSGNYSVSNETVQSENGTKELFVIKAVVYEVGILTEVSDEDNSTADASNYESNERLDLTFFNAHNNGSLIDLGDIPLPVEVNITGTTYTQILPFHVGEVGNLSDIVSILPLPEQILNFTRDENTFLNISETPYDTYLPEDASSSSQDVLHKDDLLKIPLIQDTILVDADLENDIGGGEDFDSSEEEEPSEDAF